MDNKRYIIPETYVVTLSSPQSCPLLAGSGPRGITTTESGLSGGRKDSDGSKDPAAKQWRWQGATSPWEK